MSLQFAEPSNVYASKKSRFVLFVYSEVVNDSLSFQYRTHKNLIKMKYACVKISDFLEFIEMKRLLQNHANNIFYELYKA